MPVFQLDFGNVALLAGSDIYIPELAEIYSLQGAELLLCSMGTQILRDDTEQWRLLKGRAIQNYLFVAASTYASSSIMYMASNFENSNPHAEELTVSGDADATFNAFGLGKHTGRAGVCDLRGETVASTGRESGVAVCSLDLTKKRKAVSYNYGIGRIASQQNERGVFRYLSERVTYPSKLAEVKAGAARAKIGFVHLPYKDTIHTKDKNWHVNILTRIREAAVFCDLVVCSEYSRGDDGSKNEEECLPDFMRGCAEIAKENNCYVAVNDIVQRLNTTLLFSRTGELIHQYQKVNTLSMMYHSEYPAGTEINVVELDFGTVGFMICADSYCQEIPRILALKGAELIILQSQSWGYDANAINEGASRTWAIENCQYVLMSNFPSSQVANRSNLIDPTGETVFASNYDMEGVYIAEINLDAVRRKVSFVLQNGKARKDYTLRSRLMNARRPELYSLLSQ
jgi:predicted amidohydrolase